MKEYKKYLLPSLAVIAAATLTACNKEAPIEQKEVDLSKIDIFEQPAKPAPSAIDPTTVQVTVNGQDVTVGKIMQAANAQLQMLAQRVPAEQLNAVQQDVVKQAEEGMIMEIVLKDAAKAAGITAEPADVRARIEQIKTQLPAEMSLGDMISQQGLTMDAFKEQLTAQMAIQKMMEAEANKVAEASDAEAQTFYNENTERFMRPEQVRASHILIKTEKSDTDEVKAEKKAKAEALAKQAKEGADFATLAKENSACPSKDQGGDLNYFAKERMVPEFSEAAYSMNAGDISGVVETQFGYHVIKVTDKKAAEQVDFTNVVANIKGFLTQQKKQQAVQAFAQDLRAKAEIKYPEAN
ncbi:peptidylprolyl isomerase [Verrucomicrobiota bacterium]